MKQLPLIFCMAALTACSDKPPAPQAAPVDHPAARAEAPWQGLQKDEQRARAVQQTVDQQAAEQRRQIEAAQQ